MTLRSPALDEDGVRHSTANPRILRRVRHSRMLLAGIQAEFGLDPRIKTFGGDRLGSRISLPELQFSKDSF
jgi:hypothetical protein